MKKFNQARVNGGSNYDSLNIYNITFQINGSNLETTTYSGTFKYLGIKFNPNGKTSINTNDLQDIIDRVKRAPLKPFQKLELIRSNIIPKLFHRLVLGKISKGLLTKLDDKVRTFMKDCMDLPHDTPTSFFYTRISDGGLGLPSFLDRVPVTLYKRVSKFATSKDSIVATLRESQRIKSLLLKCNELSNIHPPAVMSTDVALKRHRTDLYKKIDGRPLCEFKENTKGQLWLSRHTRIVNGRAFKNLVKLRIGKLTTKENATRGRDVEKKCRHCLRVNESMQHVIQHCHFTHFPRMQRHECQKKGFTVLWEPIFTTRTGRLKPDIVVVANNTICVIDISIVTENMRYEHMAGASRLKDIWNFKKNYYDRPELRDILKDRFDISNFFFGAVILSLQGIWCKENDKSLEACGILLSRRDIFVVRSMEHTVKIWNFFMRASL